MNQNHYHYHIIVVALRKNSKLDQSIKKFKNIITLLSIYLYLVRKLSKNFKNNNKF